jgi:addiction module RelE/StbE family toxin
MAEVIWSEPALGDLDTIADYIALDNRRAASELVRRVFKHVDQLVTHPLSGPKVPELRGWRYRQISEPPCRIIYRFEKKRIYILHVVRGEQLLRPKTLAHRRKNQIK